MPENTGALGVWLLWLLGASLAMQSTRAAAQQRVMLYDTTVYCNITSESCAKYELVLAS